MIDRQIWQRAGSGWGREEWGMADRSGDALSKALGATAAFAAAYGTRKLVTVAWKRITGKEPPSDPHDPQVSIGEALTWALVLGVAMETARLLAGRVATKNIRRSPSGDQ
jgi:hypothetical protein